MPKVKTFTKKGRKAIYLQALESISNNIDDMNFVCNTIGMIVYGKNFQPNIGEDFINKKTFPEFFMFKDHDEAAWLSLQKCWNDVNEGFIPFEKMNNGKIIILSLCLVM